MRQMTGKLNGRGLQGRRVAKGFTREMSGGEETGGNENGGSERSGTRREITEGNTENGLKEEEEDRIGGDVRKKKKGEGEKNSKTEKMRSMGKKERK